MPRTDARLPRMTKLFDAMPAPLDLDRRWTDDQMRHDWQSILADLSHPRHGEAADVLAEFVASLKKRWSDDKQKMHDRLEWTRFFRRNYRQVVELSRGD